MKILHGLTGSVAASRAHTFSKYYEDSKHEVKYVLTSSARNFDPYIAFNRHWDQPLYMQQVEFEDVAEWQVYEDYQKVLHIELTKWADAFIVAPCSANTLAKLANGLCDNLLTCCARAWDFNKPFIVAPAMNTKMWDHPITKEHIDKIKSWGIKVVDPVVKTLYCGDTGMGALANVEDIIKVL